MNNAGFFTHLCWRGASNSAQARTNHRLLTMSAYFCLAMTLSLIFA